MTSAVLSLLATAAIGASPAAIQGPGPPIPTFISYPCAIRLGCVSPAGALDPANEFAIQVRDQANNPIAGAVVRVEFNRCPDVSVCTAQIFPGLIVSCSATSRSVAAVTGPNGIARFNIVGGIAHQVPAPGAAGCCDIYVDGFLLTDGTTYQPMGASAFDLSGGDGLTVADLSLWLADYFGGVYQQRDDYDRPLTCTAVVNVPDLGRWLTAYFGGYVVGCNAAGGTICP